MEKWSQRMQDNWKHACENNTYELNPKINEAILIFIGQIEYLKSLINQSQFSSEILKDESNKDIDKRIKNLEKRINKLEKISNPKEELISRGIYYKDGKPTKSKKPVD